MIPKVFHRIFLDDPIPDKFQQFWRKFQELHPGWEFKTWGSKAEALEWSEIKDVWPKVNQLAGITDLLRYEIILREGGIYVDTDVEPLKAWESLLDGDPFVGWESSERLCPTVIGAEPGHPAMMKLLEDIIANVEENPGEKDPVIQTGPIPLTKSWQGRDDVRRLPMSYFYPVGPTQRRLLGRVSPPSESYGLHHWAKGWAKSAR